MIVLNLLIPFFKNVGVFIDKEMLESAIIQLLEFN